ncbi:anti-sigma factor family protein [Microvirga sp. GCM10011540]|uniref:anti-sigma factor family protein n=1 Tax=Microvirga sp. GCM10011540 TaxID=3317338 RepID=UPI00361DEEAD
MTDERPIGEDDLQAYVDGRLAPGRLRAVGAYLADNPAAAAQVAVEAEQRRDLRERLAFKANEPIPARLRVANIMAQGNRPSRFRWGAVAAALAWLALGLAAGTLGGLWLAGGLPMRQAAAGTAADDAITAYRTYVGERLHPVEVGADQEAHLVQWLSRRVGKTLVAPDLTGQGYRLMGGRLLPAGAEPAALFMYDDGRGRRLTLYARSSHAEEETSFRYEAQNGVSAFSWIDRGLSYVVTGSIGRDELLAVAQSVYRQLENRSAPAGNRL